jgi:hypothetical protein
VSLLFFAIYPVISVMSFITAKDGLFIGFFVLFAVMLYELYLDEKVFFRKFSKPVMLAAIILLLCLFKNNAVYVMMVSLIPLILSCRKHWRQVLLTVLSPLVLFFLISGPGYKAFGIEPGDQREMLSVPMQQLALVSIRQNVNLSEQEKQAIAALLPVDLTEVYNPRFADPVKDAFKTDVYRNNREFYQRMWFGLFWQYPLDFFDAALDLNLAYWYPDTDSAVNYLETHIYGILDGDNTRKSVIPALYRIYDLFGNYVYLQIVPVIGFMLNIGAAIWFLFFGVVLCYVKKLPRLTLIFWPLIAYWLTHLAGPVANLRYMLPAIMCLPICIGIVLQEKRFEKGEMLE